MRVRSEFPESLRAVIEHSQRFYDVLDAIEEAEPGVIWIRGRAEEVRTTVRDVLRSFRAAVIDATAADAAITAHLDNVHRLAGTGLVGVRPLGAAMFTTRSPPRART